MTKLKICLLVFALRFYFGVRNLRYRPFNALFFLPVTVGIAVLWISRPTLLALVPFDFPWLLAALDYMVTALAVASPVWFVIKIATSFRAKGDKTRIREGFWNANKQLDTDLLFVVWIQREKGTNIIRREVFSYDIDGETWEKCMPTILWALDSRLDGEIEIVGNKRIRFSTVPNLTSKMQTTPEDSLFRKQGE